ncbi:hypothetical protein SAMN02745206_01430 [Desulfacinum infernum DSM 9756]|jgi:hypothetical protein|uniref:Uncharacterized protein n=1 Tax=Desulfacinum infernum DSM 9756 TaxID=1121391 RepID=A0A1M4ZE64_9BACT|nr:DUF6599 family protein [Desulfacinum infernum]SHF16072.1 hypothetical protein SAMN02745206_01430 [Desulfacinum infernum DSM 9756]
MNPRAHPKTPGKRERLTALGVLGLIALTAAGVFLRQFHADPLLSGTAVPAPRSRPKASPPPAPPALNGTVTDPFTPLSPPESFDSATLSDKINGKADLYLTAGFRNLTTRRVALKDAPDRWAEIFLYQMENPESAFAVYSQQRRSKARPLAGISRGYATANAFYAVAGSYYLEAVAASEDPDLTRHLESLFRRLWESVSEREIALPELAFFPEKGARLDQAVLYIGGAFGYDGFSKVYAVPYDAGGNPMTAFVALEAGKDGAEAARGYIRFLEENGARRLPDPDAAQGIVVLDLFGWTEVAFSHGPYVAGVHEAEARDPALALARALKERLSAK